MYCLHLLKSKRRKKLTPHWMLLIIEEKKELFQPGQMGVFTPDQVFYFLQVCSVNRDNDPELFPDN